MKLRMDISDLNEELITDLEAIFNASQGKCNVEFFVEDSIENISVKLPSKSRKIGITSELTTALDKIGSLTYELS